MENLKLNEACREQAVATRKKGFINDHIPTLLMLIVSELSEALEADRKDRHADIKAFEKDLPVVYTAHGCYPQMSESVEDAAKVFKEHFEKHIKDSFEDEIADAFLRLMDLCGRWDIDIEKHIRLKAAYNQLRPIKHGKKY